MANSRVVTRPPGSGDDGDGMPRGRWMEQQKSLGIN